MIVQAKIKISQKDIKENTSVYLHAYLFSILEKEYAQMVHEDKIKPFSQYILKEKGDFYWYINTLDLKCYENLLKPLLDNVDKIYLNSEKRFIDLNDKVILRKQKNNDFVDEFYRPLTNKYIDIFYLTTSSVKIENKHIIFPSIYHTIISIAKRFNYFSNTFAIEDEEVIQHIIKSFEVVDYKLSTSNFNLKQHAIKGFSGELTLTTSELSFISSITRLILKYGEITGVGVKTALGMGAFRCKVK